MAMMKTLIDEDKYICVCGKMLKKKSKSRHIKTETHLFILRRICDSLVETLDPAQTETENMIKEPIHKLEL